MSTPQSRPTGALSFLASFVRSGRAASAATASSTAPLVATLALGLVAACRDASTAPPPSGAQGAVRVASVEYTGTRAALYLGNDGARKRVTFTGATDPVAGNSTQLPPLADANLLALGPLTWSPDGERLAFVATLAYDQSQVVVAKKDGSEPRVASVNTQIILGGLDWSPDGTRLVYGMSTLPGARGVDLFTTDLATDQVRRVTQGGSYRPLGGTVRFSATGSSLLYARKIREGGAPLFESISEVRRIDLTNGTDLPISGEIVGEVQAIARSGGWAIVIRRTAAVGGDYDRALVRVPLVGGVGEQTLVSSGRLDAAQLSPDDAHIVLVRSDASSGAHSHVTLGVNGGGATPLAGTSDKTVAASAWFPR